MELSERPAQQTRDVHLTDTGLFCDLALRHLAEVPELDDSAFAFRKALELRIASVVEIRRAIARPTPAINTAATMSAATHYGTTPRRFEPDRADHDHAPSRHHPPPTRSHPASLAPRQRQPIGPRTNVPSGSTGISVYVTSPMQPGKKSARNSPNSHCRAGSPSPNPPPPTWQPSGIHRRRPEVFTASKTTRRRAS